MRTRVRCCSSVGDARPATRSSHSSAVYAARRRVPSGRATRSPHRPLRQHHLVAARIRHASRLCRVAGDSGSERSHTAAAFAPPISPHPSIRSFGHTRPDVGPSLHAVAGVWRSRWLGLRAPRIFSRVLEHQRVACPACAPPAAATRRLRWSHDGSARCPFRPADGARSVVPGFARLPIVRGATVAMAAVHNRIRRWRAGRLDWSESSSHMSECAYSIHSLDAVAHRCELAVFNQGCTDSVLTWVDPASQVCGSRR